MAITLAKLCKDCEAKYNMKLIAGNGGMENTVRWVHMVEDSEVPDFLHGNELVFTTGIGHISDGNHLTGFVRKLKVHNAAGVVINLGPYISRIPDDVIQFCNDNDFPIFSLPWEIHIIDITFDYCSRIIENEQSETSVAEAFCKVIENVALTGNYIQVFVSAGFMPAKPFRIICTEFFQNGVHATERIEQYHRVKLWRMLTQSETAAAMFVYSGHLVVVRQNCDDAQIRAMEAQLTKNTASNISFIMGASDEGHGYESIGTLYRQAKAAVTTGLCDKKRLVLYRDIGVDKILCGIEDTSILDNYIEGLLSPIRKYDRENNANCLNILKMYLESGCSVKAVSEQMNVHRNTVNYQVRQIKENFSLEFDEQTKTNLALAFRILKLKEKK